MNGRGGRLGGRQIEVHVLLSLELLGGNCFLFDSIFAAGISVGQKEVPFPTAFNFRLEAATPTRLAGLNFA